MPNNIYITKAAGESEQFSENKLKRSMYKTGASYTVINRVIAEIRKNISHGDSTSKIYSLAFKLLKNESKTFAARYGLKKAVMYLGPDGFPFEKYIAKLLEFYGYRTYTNEIFQGKCITHEIDVVAEIPERNVHAIIEAKFHSRPGRKTDAKDAMYTHARFLDINYAWVAKRKAGAKPRGGELQNWLVTNTEATTQALKYASCVNMQIISWDYPNKKGLRDLINFAGLYPITVLFNLSNQQKRQLMRFNIIMCKELINNKHVKRILRLNQKQFDQLEAEIKSLCTFS